MQAGAGEVGEVPGIMGVVRRARPTPPTETTPHPAGRQYRDKSGVGRSVGRGRLSVDGALYLT